MYSDWNSSTVGNNIEIIRFHDPVIQCADNENNVFDNVFLSQNTWLHGLENELEKNGRITKEWVMIS